MPKFGATHAFWVLPLALFTGCGGRSANNATGDDMDGGGKASSFGGSASDNPAPGGAGRSGAPAMAGQGASHAGTNSSGATGGTAAAGSASTAGGASGMPTMGSGGVTPAGGVPAVAGAGGGVEAITPETAAAVEASCSTLCEEINVCGLAGGLGQMCEADCGGSLTVRGEPCAQLGLEMSTCLKQARSFESDCTQSFFRAAQTQCFKQVTAYQECVAGGPGVQLPPALCAQISSATDEECVEDRKCLNSTWYSLKCESIGDGGSNCTCKVHGDFIYDASSPQMVTASPKTACKERIADCLALPVMQR